MKHKLIIVDGQSMVGKSTISKSVYHQISRQEKAYWLHEECEMHPIRYKEFEAGNIHSLEGMEFNRQVILQKWEKFKDEVEVSKQIVLRKDVFYILWTDFFWKVLGRKSRSNISTKIL